MKPPPRLIDRRLLFFTGKGGVGKSSVARMQTALLETVVEGINTNIPLHRELMVDAKFMDGGKIGWCASKAQQAGYGIT